MLEQKVLRPTTALVRQSPESTQPSQRDAVRSAAVVVASRYHAVLVAAAAGVPVLADVRQAKLASLAATDGLEAHVTGFGSWDEVVAVPPVPSGGAVRSSTGATNRALQHLREACRSGEG